MFAYLENLRESTKNLGLIKKKIYSVGGFLARLTLKNTVFLY